MIQLNVPEISRLKREKLKEKLMNHEDSKSKDAEAAWAENMFKQATSAQEKLRNITETINMYDPTLRRIEDNGVVISTDGTEVNLLSPEEVNRICGPLPLSRAALDEQVGGDHYKHFAIQPIEFTTRNKLGFIPGCIIKRICRYNRPGGKGKEDLEKIIHEVKCLIEMEY